MIQTFDCIFLAAKDKELRDEFIKYIREKRDVVLIRGDHKMTFNGVSRYLEIRAVSDNDLFAHKIVPARVPYDVLCRMLDGNLDNCVGIEYL